MATNIGLNVIEVDGSAPATIQGAAVSIAAFNVTTMRGIPNKPLRVTNLTEFADHFGKFEAPSLGAYMVKGFFDNGGERAYVNRLAGAGAGPSKADLHQGDASTPILLKFTGGFRGAIDPGRWADGTVVRIAPSFASTVRDGATVAATGTALVALAGFSVGDSVVVSSGVHRVTASVVKLDPATGAIEWKPALVTPSDFDPKATTVSAADFDLAITAPGATSPTESWARLTLRAGAANYAPAMLNDPIAGSKLVRATDGRDPDKQEPPDTTAGAASVTLEGGISGSALDATAIVGDAAARTGLHALDPLDVQLVCVESTDPGVARAALDYCQARGDCMFIGAVPKGSVGAGTAIEYGGGLQSKNAYGALYGPWIAVADPAGTGPSPTRTIPPVGHVAGMYARIETTRGIHKAPAGDEARLFGALDIEYQLTDADHTDLVTMGAVNGIRAVAGAGIVVDASRTLSSDIRWRYVGVRLLFNYVKSSLRQGLRWVKQEPNRDQLWDAVKFTTVRPFLLGLWRRGAFGTGDPDQVFAIVCDATNNPPAEVDKGNFKIEVYFYPSKPAETILVVVGQQAFGSSASEK